MALAHVEFDATDESGNLLSNVQARVELEGGGLVSIYSDRAGSTPYSNPQTFADGKISFYVAGGAYKITLTAGAFSRVLRYRASGLLQEKDGLSAAAVSFTPAAGISAANVQAAIEEAASAGIGVAYPEQFGATGGSDDTVALQDCLDSAYANDQVVILSKLYTTTAPLTLNNQVVRGVGKQISGIHGNHLGRTLELVSGWTDNLVLSDFLIRGNGTDETDGDSTGLWVSSPTEGTAHLRLENVRFLYHDKGIDGADDFTTFDSTFDQVDFYGCVTWGEKLSGSGVNHFGCTYRLNGWGVFADNPSALSIGGGMFFGGTFVGNDFDFVFGDNEVRPIGCFGVWFEQTKTCSFGTIAVGEVLVHALTLDNCLFQPAATAAGNGTFNLSSLKGILTIKQCIVYTDLYGSASLPGFSEYGADSNLQFVREACATINGSGTIAKLDDVSGARRLSGLLTVNGQIAFPATENPSADANTLDDYEEGTWTPVLTFATPGNLAVTYGTQNGRYTKIGRTVTFSMEVFTSAFTHTTASGNLKVTGFPFTHAAAPSTYTGVRWQGITKAGYTDVLGAVIAGTATAELRASASATAVSPVTAADMPTGGTVQIGLSSTYTA